MAQPRDTLTPYMDVGDLAGIVGTIATADEPLALKFLRAASRVADAYTKRFYFQLAASELDLDVLPGQTEFITPYDLTAVPTKLEVDTDGDGTYATDITADTNLFTLGNQAPYWGFEARNGSLLVGNKTLRVTASWGWPQVLESSGDAVADAPLSAGATTITVADSTAFEVGQTALIESEQVSITDRPTSTTLTVIRGANGTTAASHVATTVIDIIRYETRVWQATGIIAARFWKRRDTAFSQNISDAGPTIEASILIDRDLARILDALRKRTL